MTATPTFAMYRRLLTTLVCERRRRAGLTPELDVREWRTGAESDTELAARRQAVETFIDETFGTGTAAQLPGDPYRAFLGGTDPDRLLLILADRLPWNWRGLGGLASTFRVVDPSEMRRAFAAEGFLIVWGELERVQHVRIAGGWIKNRFDHRKIYVEPWAVAHYSDPCALLQWVVARARSAAEGALRASAWPGGGSSGDVWAAGPIKNKHSERVSRRVSYNADLHVRFVPEDNVGFRRNRTTGELVSLSPYASADGEDQPIPEDDAIAKVAVHLARVDGRQLKVLLAERVHPDWRPLIERAARLVGVQLTEEHYRLIDTEPPETPKPGPTLSEAERVALELLLAEWDQLTAQIRRLLTLLVEIGDWRVVRERSGLEGAAWRMAAMRVRRALKSLGHADIARRLRAS